MVFCTCQKKPRVKEHLKEPGTMSFYGVGRAPSSGGEERCEEAGRYCLPKVNRVLFNLSLLFNLRDLVVKYYESGRREVASFSHDVRPWNCPADVNGDEGTRISPNWTSTINSKRFDATLRRSLLFKLQPLF
ncbi:unnamed protein product [Pieris macdunnoughi]|uniref:Uncharacterized protein n=1 Tax=Pieris macdunnoughi TaxID=345717 RepID=A0A821VS06_9NEOP|nr:unnamed protein product [Pieris macdunnoughi]